MARDYLKTGTWIKLAEGEYYRITGSPLGEGGGSIVYPCEKAAYMDGVFHVSKSRYALKECYPLSGNYVFMRNEQGEIVSQSADPIAEQYLKTVKQMQLSEYAKAEMIYNTSSRMIPVLSGADHIEISVDDGESFTSVNNTVSVMPSLELKGNALRAHLAENTNLSVLKSLQLTKLLLLSVKEIHDAGYLHLDIQDGNIFVRGSMGEENLVSLIDFGSTRQMLADGLCETIWDCVVFSTNGFSAPEIQEGNDGTLRLGKEADIYSIGYTLLLMLTGTKYSQRELDFLSTGHILSGRRIKKIGCPVHMADRLRQILSHALKRDPQERYHSCDEMLAEVTDFLDALTPYKTTLSQVVYDAFICYRHGAIDSPVSKALQQRLEHLRCPKGIVAKKKQIKKVFVDEGELASCADFGLQIREALKNSEWLIVICSPDTKESPWVNLEIRTFLEYHDRSHILALITEGEPKDVFPEALLGTALGPKVVSGTALGVQEVPEADPGVKEVLAADARGDNLSQIIKKVKKDAALKLAAPIFGVTYDTLKQRHREYRRKQVASILSLACIVFCVFWGYSAFQKHQIALQKQEKLENQAEYAAERALQLLGAGDRDGALKEILSVRDEKNPDKLVSAYQTYALNQALSSYTTGEWIDDYGPTGKVGKDVTQGDYALNGSCYYTVDENNCINCYSVETKKELWKIDASVIEKEIEKEKYRFSDRVSPVIKQIVSYTDDQLVAICEYVLAVINIESGDVIRVIPMNVSCNSKQIAVGGDIITIWQEDDNLYFYDLNTGKQVSRFKISRLGEGLVKESNCEYSLSLDLDCLTMNSTGSLLAFEIAYGRLSKTMDNGEICWDDEEEQELQKGVYLYDINQDTLVLLSENTAVSLVFYQDQYLITQECTDYGKENSSKDAFYNSYRTVAYDLSTGDILFSGEEETVKYDKPAIFIKSVPYGEKTRNLLITAMDKRITISDIENGNPLAQLGFDSEIINIMDWGMDSFLVAVKSGRVQRIRILDDIYSGDMVAVSEKTAFASASAKRDSIALCLDGEITFFEITVDESLASMELPVDKNLQKGQLDFYHFDDKSYYMIYRRTSDSSTPVIQVFDEEDHSLLYEYSVSDEEELCAQEPFLFQENGMVWCCFFEKNKTSFGGEDMDEVRCHLECLTSDETNLLKFSGKSLYTYSFSYDNQKHCIIYKSSEEDYGEDACVIASVNGSEITEEKKLKLGGQLEDYFLTGDGEYAYFQVWKKYKRDEDLLVHMICDMDTKDVFILEDVFPLFSKEDLKSTKVVMSESGSLLALYDEEKVYIVDLSARKIQSEIPMVGKYTETNMAFFRETSTDPNGYLLVSNGDSVLLYETKTGEYVNSLAINTWFSVYTERKDVFDLQTDESGKFFSLSEETGLGSLCNEYIISVDEELKMVPYAEMVNSGTDFVNEKTLIFSDPVLYTAHFWNQEQLVQKAEKILAKAGSILDSETENNSDEKEANLADLNEQINTISDNTVDQEKKPSTDSMIKTEEDLDELNYWDIMDRIEPVEAEDRGDAYCLSLSEKEGKRITKVTASIWKEAEYEGEPIYIPVLKGRVLEDNGQNQFLLEKNQETLGIKGEEPIPLLRTEESLKGETRAWTIGPHTIWEADATKIESSRYLYLMADERADGSITYSISKDSGEKILDFDDDAYIKNAKGMEIVGTGFYIRDGRTDSGTMMPAETINAPIVEWSDLDLESVDDLTICSEKLDQFSGAFFGQICVYYDDGRIQTTDLLPLMEKTESSERKIVIEDGFHYEIYKGSASLKKVEGEYTEIDLPSEVQGVPLKRIESLAFYHCDGLKTVCIPASVERIDACAFRTNDTPLEILLSEDQKNYVIRNDILMTGDGKSVLCAAKLLNSLSIPDGVEGIMPGAFMNYEQLKEVALPESLKQIGSAAFSGVYLKELVLPDGVEYIGDQAFGVDYSIKASKGSDIQSLHIGKNVRYIGENAFTDMCVREFDVDPDNPVYCSVDGVIFSKDQKVLHTYPSGKSGPYLVPDGVEVIRENAFFMSGAYADKIPEAWGITDLTLSDSVKKVERNNIPQNGKLQRVKLGKGLEEWETWNVLDYLDLEEETNLVKDPNGSIYTKDRSMLISCSKDVKEYVFPDSVTSIGSRAFDDCGLLEKIIIPAGMNLKKQEVENFVDQMSGIFYYGPSIKEFVVEEGNPDFSSENGNLLSSKGKIMLVEVGVDGSENG